MAAASAWNSNSVLWKSFWSNVQHYYTAMSHVCECMLSVIVCEWLKKINKGSAFLAESILRIDLHKSMWRDVMQFESETGGLRSERRLNSHCLQKCASCHASQCVRNGQIFSRGIFLLYCVVSCSLLGAFSHWSKLSTKSNIKSNTLGEDLVISTSVVHDQ